MKLIDVFTNLLYFTTVNKEFDFGQFNLLELRKRYNAMITEAEQSSNQLGISDSRWQHALFAIAAWVDEVIMLSAWPHRDQWQRQSLQRTYFHTANGGVEFYKRLESFDHTQTSLLELYDVIMSLGFKGELFSDTDSTKRQQITENTIQLLASSCDMSIPKRLFQNSCSSNDYFNNNIGFNWHLITRAAFFSIPPVMFTLIYIIFYSKLSVMTGTILNTIFQ